MSVKTDLCRATMQQAVVAEEEVLERRVGAGNEAAVGAKAANAAEAGSAVVAKNEVAAESVTTAVKVEAAAEAAEKIAGAGKAGAEAEEGQCIPSWWKPFLSSVILPNPRIRK